MEQKGVKNATSGPQKALTESTSFRGFSPPGPHPVSARSLCSLVTQSPNIQVGTSTSIHFCFGSSNKLVEKACIRERERERVERERERERKREKERKRERERDGRGGPALIYLQYWLNFLVLLPGIAHRSHPLCTVDPTKPGDERT